MKTRNQEKYCSNCGKRIPPEYDYCVSCGTPVEDRTQTVREMSEGFSEWHESYIPDENDYEPRSPSGGARAVTIALLGLIAVFAVAIFFWLVLANGDGEKEEMAETAAPTQTTTEAWTEEEEEEEERYTDATQILYVNEPDGYANVRKGPGTEYDVVGTLDNGTPVTVWNLNDGWYMIYNGAYSGMYISSSTLSVEY